MAERLFDEAFLRRLERLALVARRASAGQTQGERRSPKRGQSVEFSDFRPYTMGDDFRRIDWNAYARLERFFIKLFVEEEDLAVHLLVDTSPSMRWGTPDKLAYAVRVAGALGYIALTGLDRVTVSAIGPGKPVAVNGGAGSSMYLPFLRGKRNALQLFEFLQRLQTPLTSNGSSAHDPGVALRAYANTRTPSGANRPGSLVLLSDLMHDGWTEGLRALASRGYEINIIHILAPEEANPEMDGDLKLIDSEDNSEVEITADYDLLSRYRQSVTAWQEEMRAFCQARGIAYIPLETSLPLEDLLFAWLERQGVLR